MKTDSFESDLLRGNTPMLVLAVLDEGPAHGYSIAKQINARTGEGLRMKQGTLYPVLYALERDGWVMAAWEHPEGERPRKVYEISDAGRTELARRVRTWQEFAKSVERMISPGLKERHV